VERPDRRRPGWRTLRPNIVDVEQEAGQARHRDDLAWQECDLDVLNRPVEEAAEAG